MLTLKIINFSFILQLFKFNITEKFIDLIYFLKIRKFEWITDSVILIHILIKNIYYYTHYWIFYCTITKFISYYIKYFLLDLIINYCENLLQITYYWDYLITYFSIYYSTYIIYIVSKDYHDHWMGALNDVKIWYIKYLRIYMLRSEIYFLTWIDFFMPYSEKRILWISGALFIWINYIT